MPNLELGGVEIAASRLEEAWKALATDHLVRSILVTDEAAPTDGRFYFRADRARVSEVLDAFVDAYPNYAWSIDPRTRILFVHPAARPLAEVLPAVVEVARDHCAVPMQSGLLAPLAGVPGLGAEVGLWGAAFTNTFDYPVDVPAGKYCVRDLLARAAAANPTKTFHVALLENGFRVTAVNLVADDLQAPPEGALAWWNLHLAGEAGRGAPDAALLAAALADTDPARRVAARAYLEAVAWQTDFDALVKLSKKPRESLWIALGVTSVLARHPEATHTASIDVLREATAAGERDDAWPVAMLELARLTGSNVVESFSERPAAPLGSQPDLVRLAQLSPAIRAFLAPRLAENAADCLGWPIEYRAVP